MTSVKTATLPVRGSEQLATKASPTMTLFIRVAAQKTTLSLKASPCQSVADLVLAAKAAAGVEKGVSVSLRSGSKMLGPQAHSDALQRVGLRSMDTLELVAPTLLGGVSAINDDSYMRSSSVVVSDNEDDMEPQVVLEASQVGGPGLNLDFLNLREVEPKTLEEKDREPLMLEKIKTYRSNVAKFEDNKEFIDDTTKRFDNNPWFKALEAPRKEAAYRVMVEAMQSNETLKKEYSNWIEPRMWYMNNNRREKLLHKIRNVGFLTLYAARLPPDNEQKKKITDYISEVSLGSMRRNIKTNLHNPESVNGKNLATSQGFTSYYHKDRNNNVPLQDVQPKFTKDKLYLATIKLLPLDFIQFLAAITPAIYRAELMVKATPNYQLFLLQLYESSRHDSMFDLLVHVCKMTEGGAKDYKDLETNLIEVYTQANLAERARLEEITDSDQLKALWSRVKVDNRPNAQRIMDRFRIHEKDKLLDALKKEMEDSTKTVPADIQKFFQVIPRPGTTKQFAVLEMQNTPVGACEGWFKNSKLLDKEHVLERIENLEGIDQPAKDSMKAELFPENEEFNEMEAGVGTKKRKVNATLYYLSVWEYDEERDILERIQHGTVPLPYKHRNKAFKENYNIQSYLLGGQNGEVFCFMRGQTTAGMRIAVMYPGAEYKVSRFDVPNESMIFKHMHGSVKIADVWDNVQRFLNPEPQLMKDENGNHIVAFTYYTKDDQLPSVYFYDIKRKKEIAQAKGCESFIKYFPPKDGKKGKMLFWRDALRLTEKDLTKCINLSKSELKNGYPRMYYIDTNFGEECKGDSIVQLISKPDEAKEIIPKLHNCTRLNTKEKMKEFPNWVLVEQDDYTFRDQRYKGGGQVFRETPGKDLFNLTMSTWMPPETAETFSFKSVNEVTLMKFAKQNDRNVVYDEVTGKTYYVNQMVKGQFQTTVLEDSDDFTKTYVFESTQNGMVCAPKMHNNILLSPQLGMKKLKLTVAKLDPTKEFNSFDVHVQATEDLHVKYVVDYPLLCSYRFPDELIVFNFADLSRGYQIFAMKDVDFAFFTPTTYQRAANRFFFAGRDQVTKKPCFVLMAHEETFQKTPALEDLNQWTFQKFLMPETYEPMLKLKNDVVEAWMDLEWKLMSDDVFPRVFIRTKDSLYQIDQNGLNILFRQDRINQFTPRKVLRGREWHYFFVKQDLTTQVSTVVALNTFNLQIIPAEVFNISGRVMAIELDKENKKSNDIFILDHQLNLYKFSSKDNKKFEELYKKSLSHIPDLKQAVKDMNPYEQMVISDSAIMIKKQIFDLETGRKQDNLYGLEKYNVHSVHQDKSSEKIFLRMTLGQNTIYSLRDNPLKRDIDVLGERGKSYVKNISFISHDKILVDMRTDRGFHARYFALFNLKGDLIEMPATLKEALGPDKTWFSIKYRVLANGNYINVLANKQDLAVIEFGPTGQVVDSIKIIDDLLEKATDSKGQTVKIMLTGDIFIIKQVDKETAFQKLDRIENGRKIVQIVFGQKISTEYSLTRQFLCWRKLNSKEINLIDHTTLPAEVTYQKIEEMNDKIRTLNLEQLFGGIKLQPYELTIEEPSLFYTLHVKPGSNFTDRHLAEMANHLQVTVKDKAIYFDLNQQDAPIIGEFMDMTGMGQMQSYIETGHPLVRMDFEEKEVTNNNVKSKEIHITKKILRTTLPHGTCLVTEQLTKIKKDSCEGTSWLFDILPKDTYRTFSELDLKEAILLRELAEKNQLPRKIPSGLLFSQFHNQTIFTLQEENLRFMQRVYKQLQEMKIEEQIENEEEEMMQNPILRKISKVLTRISNISFDDNKQIRRTSIIRRQFGEQVIRDALLRLAMIDEEFSIFDSIGTSKMFKLMLENQTQATIQLLNACFRETYSCKKILTMAWPEDKDFLTFRTNNNWMTDKELLERINAKYGASEGGLKPITVQVFNIAWILNQGNFSQLAPSLAGQDDSFYQTKFMTYLMGEFWGDVQKQLIRYEFLPFLCSMTISIFFLHQSLKVNDEGERGNHVATLVLGLLSMAFTSKALVQEAKQIYQSESKLDYLLSFWNIVDLGYLGAIVFIFVCTIPTTPFVSLTFLRVLAAFASFFMMNKLFDWLRLFEKTAFFIKLIEQTLSDISSFMILLIASLMMFGMPLVMLNLNRTSDNDIVSTNFGFWMLDLLANQYFLALGEFNYDNFTAGPESSICFLFFFLATFIVQITMLNMLIAIMGDSYGKVMENSEVNATKTKLELMSDIASIIQEEDEDDQADIKSKEVFLYVVTPEQEAEEGQSELAQHIDRVEDIVCHRIEAIESQIQALNQDMLLSRNLDQTRDQSLFQQVAKLEKNMVQVQAKNDKIISALTKNQDQIMDNLAQIMKKMGNEPQDGL